MTLTGKTIALLAGDLYEDLVLWYPYYRLQEEGAEVVIIGTGEERYKGKNGLSVVPDRQITEVSHSEFEAVVIPGGYAPDHMRRHRALLEFVQQLFEQGKIVAYICHAGWVPASAGILKDRRVTSFFSIRDDLENAGAHWVDESVVKDGNLISSRYPGDLPNFCRTIIEALAES